MTDTNPVADFVQRQATLRREHLAVDAQHLADAAGRLAASIRGGHACGGDASRLAQESMQIALTAVRLDEMAETITYLSALDPEGPKP